MVYLLMKYNKQNKDHVILDPELEVRYLKSLQIYHLERGKIYLKIPIKFNNCTRKIRRRRPNWQQAGGCPRKQKQYFACKWA